MIDDITQLPGVGEQTALKLKELGYGSLDAISTANLDELSENAGISADKAKKIIEAARELYNVEFSNAYKLLKERESIVRITTGSKAIDKLLNGGIETKCITETHGAFGSGKCVAKDTKVLYLNPEAPHFETMEAVYDKYSSMNGEKPFEEGFVVDVPSVQVFGMSERGITPTPARHMYRAYQEKIVEVTTRRGRKLRITPTHRLLCFDGGVVWKPSAELRPGECIASPGTITPKMETSLPIEDAYFLGLFVAEGASNPLSITTGSEKIRDWLRSYIKERFGYTPTIRARKGKSRPNYVVLLRKKTCELLGKLSDSNAATKFVPKEVFCAGGDAASSFLAGYLDGDGCLGGKCPTATTKSSELASALSYLLLRLGIKATLKEKKVEGNTYYRLSIPGKDRQKIAALPYVEKQPSYRTFNSSYGLPPSFVSYLQEEYRATLGGNRGSRRKKIGRQRFGNEIFYKHLNQTRSHSTSINDFTAEKLLGHLLEGKNDLLHSRELISRLESCSHKEFLEAYSLLPFAMTDIHSDLGLKEAAVHNYAHRGLPKNRSRVLQIKAALLRRLNSRVKRLDNLIGTIKNILTLSWDPIVSVRELPYNDYVYDFVVPEGHCFVGGNLPTIMHNSQLTMQLAVNVQLPPNKGGLGGRAVIIDSEGSFRPERVKQMAEALSLDAETVLKNIYVARAYTSDDQMMIAEKVAKMAKEKNIKLVIVDSLTCLFRSEYLGRGMLSERQQKLNQHLSMLHKIADDHNIAVYVTNQVHSRPDVFFGDPTKPIGGHILGHSATFRIYLRRSKGTKRIARLIDSPHLPDGEAVFQVTMKGVHD